MEEKRRKNKAGKKAETDQAPALAIETEKYPVSAVLIGASGMLVLMFLAVIIWNAGKSNTAPVVASMPPVADKSPTPLANEQILRLTEIPKEGVVVSQPKPGPGIKPDGARTDEKSVSPGNRLHFTVAAGARYEVRTNPPGLTGYRVKSQTRADGSHAIEIKVLDGQPKNFEIRTWWE